MTTHMVDHLDAFYAEARRILMDGEIKRTPRDDDERATESEEAAQTLMKLGQCADRLFMNVIGEADEEIGALTETEKRNSFQIVTGALENNWDFPFIRFAKSIWSDEDEDADEPEIAERLSPRTQGIQTGRMSHV